MGADLRWSLADCTNTLLREIAMPELKQKDIASTYGLAILSSEDVDWRAVNEAIVARWGEKARDRIKAQAWKRINEAQGAGASR